jgi:hypothetical protein
MSAAIAVCVANLLLFRDRFRLGLFPRRLVHFFDVVNQHVATFHAADDDVRQFVAVDVGFATLPAVAGVAVGLLWHQIDALFIAHQL